jgi:6-phosphogluconate dehydrogenase
MDHREADIGLVGLGVMGRNLAFNIADHGFGIVGLDRNEEKVKALTSAGDSGKMHGVNTVDCGGTPARSVGALAALHRKRRGVA